MGIEPRTISKADALAEAYKRGLLPPDKKAAYEEAQRRGLVGGAQTTQQPVAPRSPGGGFDMVPSSPQARRDMLTPKAAPQSMAAAPGAQYSFQPTPEMAASAPMRAEAQASNEAQRAKGLIPLTTEQGTKWVADPAKQMGDIAAQQRLDRESAERREAAAAYGAGQDMIITQDQSGQLRPGSAADDDISKAILTSPQRAINAGIGAVQSIGNIPSDVIDAGLQRVHSVGGGGEQGRAPRLDIPRVPIPEGMESITGDLAQGLAQFLISRKAVGSVAPGGGTLAQVGKDALAVGAGFDGSTGRVADMLDLNAIPEGPLRDYAAWLKTQPEDSQLVGRFKNLLEDMTFSGPAVAPQMAVRGVQAVGNALTPGARAASPPPAAAVPPPQAAAQAAPQPSVAPVSQAPIPQAPRGAGQPGASGAGQQAAGAVPPGGPATLQAVPAPPAPIPRQQQLVDRDTIKITRRIMRSAGIKDADVMGYLPGAIQRFKGLNDPRIPLAFFLKSDLPKYFPEEVANRVGTNLDVWGRARNAETGRNDTSRATINKTITDLRKTQQDFLTQSAERNLFKGSLIGQEDQIVASLRETGRKGYEPVLDNARQVVDGRRAPTPDEAAAVEEIRGILSDPMMLGYVDDATRIRAKKDGVDLDQLMQQDPIGAAHWLQSEFRRLSDAAEDAVTGKPTRMSQAYDDLRDMVLDPLKRAAPGYEGAMNRYGHLYGAKDAVRFGKGIFTSGRSAYDTAQKVRSFKKLGRRQQTVAWKSVRDEFLNEFRGTPEDAAAKVTRMQSEGALDILEQLGPRGKRFADDIRSIAQVENPNLRAIDQGSGSPTYANQKGGSNAVDMVQSPVNQAIGAFGDKGSLPTTMLGDALLFSSGLPPVLTLGKGVTWTIDRFGNPSKKVLARATEGLYGLPKANALAPTNGPRRVGASRSPAAAALEAEEAEDMAELLRALDATERNAKTRGGRKGQKLLNQIDAKAKQAPKPPAKTGGRKPPQSNASPTVTGALIGGGLGYAAAPEDQKGLGILAGAGLGAIGANSLAKLGSPKPKAVKPPPGAGVKPPPVGAKAFVPVEGAPRIDTSNWTPTDFNAARKQLNEMMQDRRTASGQQLADLDSEVTSLRQALQVDGPPPEFNDVPMASRFNTPVEGMWPKGSPEEKAIKSAIANKRWTTQPVPASKIIPTQDSVFFDYAKAAGRYAGDDRLPIRVKQGDQYFVADGHHRLMAQAGKDVVNARVIDLAPTPAGTGGKKPPAQAGFGGSKTSLPMDEASRMQRMEEQGYKRDWWHSGVMSDEFDSAKGELGLHVGSKSAATDAARQAWRQRKMGARSDAPASANPIEPRELAVRGNFAETPDLQDFGDPLEYLKGRGRSTLWDDRYSEMWAQLDGAARAAYKSNDRAAWREAVHTAAKKYGVDGWGYHNEFEGGKSRVIFSPSVTRRTDATFDPAQEGSSKLLAGFGGKTRGVIDNLKQDTAIVGATSIAASANNPDDPAALGIPAAALLVGGKYGARLGNGLKRGPKPPPGVAKPPPAQSGFGGGKGTPRPPPARKPAGGNRLRVAPGVEVLPRDPNAPPPPKRNKGAYEMPPSRDLEGEAIRKELKAAKIAHNADRRRHAMKDNREELWAASLAREMRASEALADHMAAKAAKVQKDASRRDRYYDAKDFVNTERGGLKVAGALIGGGLVGTAGLIAAANMGDGDKKAKSEPTMSPSNPRFYWERVVTKDKPTMQALQGALAEWGHWDAEVPLTGGYGKNTKEGVRVWREEAGLDPDGPMTRTDLARLLAGPRGYEGDGGRWGEKGKWYTGDGKLIRVPQ